MGFDALAHAFADWLHRHPGVGGWAIFLVLAATAVNIVAGIWHRATRDTKVRWIEAIRVGHYGIGAAFLRGAQSAGIDPIGVIDVTMRIIRWGAALIMSSRGLPNLGGDAAPESPEVKGSTGEDRITLTTAPPSDPPPPTRLA